MIRFSRYFWLYAFISGLILVPGIYSLVRFGLRPSIDFTGGTLWSYHLTNQWLKVSSQMLPKIKECLSRASNNPETIHFFCVSNPMEVKSWGF